MKDASIFVKMEKFFILMLYFTNDYYLWFEKYFFFFRGKITNIPWTPHIMLIKFLSFSHSVYQGKGQPSILCYSVGWSPHRNGTNGRLSAERPVLRPLQFLLNKLSSHQTSSQLLLVENILRDLLDLLLEIMESFSIIKVKPRINVSSCHISIISVLRVAGISWRLFSNSFLPS